MTLISTARPEWPTGVSAGTTSISANGRYVAYSAVPWATLDGGEVYLYDRQTKQSTTISADSGRLGRQRRQRHPERQPLRQPLRVLLDRHQPGAR